MASKPEKKYDSSTLAPFQKAARRRIHDDLELTVFITAGLRGYRDDIRDVLRLLSPSPTARLLAKSAKDAGYGIVIEKDSPYIGAVDHAEKTIYLRRGMPLAETALTLAHELCHVSQNVNGGLDVETLRDHPLQSIRTLRAMEADARAYEMRVALELAYPPTGQAADPSMLEALCDKSDNPLLRALIEKALPRLPGGIAPETMMIAAFKACYGYGPLRRIHENIILEKLESFGKKDLRDPAYFKGEMSAAALTARLDAHCRTYINVSPHIDLASEDFSAPSAEAKARLTRLFAPASAPKNKAPVP